MASPPEHLVIQIDKLPVRSAADPIPCAVCLMREADAVSRAEGGSIRCKGHEMRCVTCRGFVSEDTHLCCHACWTYGRQNTALVVYRLRRIIYCHTPTVQDQPTTCSCMRCSSNTLAYTTARAMEEGEAHRLSPPTSRESEHAVLSFKID